MDTLMEFLTSKEVEIVVLIAISICIVGTIYFVIEKIYKNYKKVNSNTLENKIIEIEENRVVVKPVIEQIIQPKPQVNTIEPITKEQQPVVMPTIKEEPIIAEKTKKEAIEKPLVIPIEKFEKETNTHVVAEEVEELIPSIENIYTEVKEEVRHQEELIYTEIEPNPEEAKEELRKATEELMKTQEMQLQENIDLTKFEEEQEENAIISIDELMQKSKVLYEQNEITQYKDEGNEPISIIDLEERMNKIKVEAKELEVEENQKTEPILIEQRTVAEEKPTIRLDDFNTVSLHDAYKEDRIFKSSPVISPIFGIEKESSTTNIELENTANYEKFDDEIKKTNEFLATLKELQKNLD